MLELFQREKAFLYELSQGSSLMNQRLLNFAQETSLNVLLKLLFLIANGTISIPRAQVDILKQSRKLKPFLQEFDNKSKLNILLNSNRETKLLCLKKFINVYNALLYTMFNEIF